MQSHRHRPLVVETGFPASLVDLIIQNRQRLRRSSEVSLIQDCSPSPPVSNHVVEEEEEEDAENCRGLLPAVLIMCVVSVLALGAKKFALGLTISAFFLIFMESMGKNAFGLLIPCHDLKKQLRLMKVKILTSVGFGSSGSIEIVRSEGSLAATSSVGDVGGEETGMDRNSKLGKLNSLSAFLEEEDEEEEVSELKKKKKKKWHKAKMKAKLKHMFARKEKKRKKTKKEEESNVEKSERGLQKEEAVVPEEEQKNKCSNSGCLIVCTIVLIGLSGGRMYALMLILSCCLLKKSGITHFFPHV